MERETTDPFPELKPVVPDARIVRRPEFVYSAALFVIAGAAVAVAIRGNGGVLQEHHPALAVFFFLYGLFTITAGYQQPGVGYVSFDRVSQVASILILGPVDAALVNGLASLVFPWRRVRRGVPIGRVVTASLNNSGLMALMILGCGLFYQALGGPVPLLGFTPSTVLLLPILIISMQAVNELLMWLFSRIRDGRASWEVHGFALALESGSGLAAILVAIVWNRMEPPVVILLLLVLSTGMLALKQFARMRLHLETLVEERTRVLREKTIELDRLVTLDQLTGLYNRRHADSVLATRMEEFRRYGHTFSIALIDLDHFKRINDELSHDVGDQVLQRIARIFTDRCRETDTVARFGGEEFIVCFPEAGAEVVAEICEELRSAVEETDWSDIAPGLQVSMSAGVAEMRHEFDRAMLLRAADMKLYEAKNGGRNLVMA